MVAVTCTRSYYKLSLSLAVHTGQSTADSRTSHIHSHRQDMKSKAALRFNRLHPDSHRDFQNIVQTARKRKESCVEGPNASDEVTNMIKNKALTKSTKEDELFCETERKKRKMVKKKITWSKNLIQVQILLDYHYSDSLTEE